MKLIASVVVVVVFLAVSVSSRGLKFHLCTKSGIECLDKKSYVFCKESSQIVIEQWGLKKCPRHHVCHEDGSIWFPCINENEIEDKSDESDNSDKSDSAEKAPAVPQKPLIQFHKCTKKGFECLDKNTFIYCPTSSKLILGKLFGKKCPPCFICQDGTFGWYPCVPEPPTDADNGRRSTESQNEQTTTEGKKSGTENDVITEEPTSRTTAKSTSRNDITTALPKERTTEDADVEETTTKEEKSGTENDVITEKLTSRIESTFRNDITTARPKESTTEDADIEETTTEEEKSGTENDVITEKPTSRSSAESTFRNDVTTALPKESTTEDTDIEETTIEEKKSGTENDVIAEDSTGRISSDVTRIELSKTTVDDRKTQTEETKVEENLPYSTSSATIQETEKNSTDNVVPVELFARPATFEESAVPHINQATPPNCYSSGVVSPGPSCQQYYECVSYFWFFYHPELKTCPTGESFSIVESRCVPSAETDCID